MAAESNAVANNQFTPSADFLQALAARRDRVYDLLDNWPGADLFKPPDIYDALFSYVRHRGKGIRPSLLLLCSGAVGGDEMQALPAAAAVEIFHIWTLVHDDIIDRDDTRRGSPTVHALYAAHARDERGLAGSESAHYGTAVAILAGDLQQSWSYALLSSLAERGVSLETVLALIRRMSSSLTPQLMEGEMLDVQFALSAPENLSESDVLDMLNKKTGALLEYAAWAGTMIGLAGAPDAEGYADKLGRFGSLCGTAFQLQDDVLGLTADETLLGKSVGADIREGKRTFVVYRALANLDQDARKIILGTLGNDSASPADIAEVIGHIRRSGALEHTRQLANEYISQAMQLLDELPDSTYKEQLRAWAAFLLAREY